MKLNNELLFTNGIELVKDMANILENVSVLELEDLNFNKTSLIIMDMVEGFINIGILSSPRVKDLIPNIISLQKKCNDKNIYTLAFADKHTKDSIELTFRPEHCLEGTQECEITKEISSLKVDKIIYKNSTNGFVNEEFNKWVEEYVNVFENYIVVGDCTDICISQFALTLKAYFNEKNKASRIIVPMDCVDTYDLGVHNADLMNLFSLYQMIDNNIEVVKEVR